MITRLHLRHFVSVSIRMNTPFFMSMNCSFDKDPFSIRLRIRVSNVAHCGQRDSCDLATGVDSFSFGNVVLKFFNVLRDRAHMPIYIVDEADHKFKILHFF